MTEPLASLSQILSRTDTSLREGRPVAATTWPTGFVPLDGQLGGGLRVGELVLLGGPQGLGKTTWTIQVARNVVRAGGRVLYFSFEHEQLTFLERVLAQAAFEAEGLEAPTTRRIRDRFQRASANGDAAGMPGLLHGLPGAEVALEELETFGQRFFVHESSGRTTTVASIRAELDGLPEGPAPVVIVDYLQKVAGHDEGAEVVEALKDLALEKGVVVLAVVAADKVGLAPGHRLRVHELRGSSSLAYEPDVVLILNEKYDAVARHHLVYGVGAAERFREWVILSIEKNRGGTDRIDLEFRKQFAHARFDPDGQLVAEQLTDERVQVDV
ncbi:MAG: DnaB helicase C-terminal domain-containing protein [Actinomycetota bacterium]|nr:DnaB helicase C-terminal domain-containing protein [Actinomycetota bacterium]